MAARYVILDTCVFAAAFYQEPYSHLAAPVVAALRGGRVDAVSPDVGIAEFMHICAKKHVGHRFGGVAYAPLPLVDVETILDDFFSLPVEWFEIRPLASSAWKHYANHGVQTADAFFLELAQQFDAEIWTTDDQFAQSAGALYARVYNLKTTPFTL